MACSAGELVFLSGGICDDTDRVRTSSGEPSHFVQQLMCLLCVWRVFAGVCVIGVRGGDTRVRGIKGGDSRVLVIKSGDSQVGVRGGNFRVRGIKGGDSLVGGEVW